MGPELKQKKEEAHNFCEGGVSGILSIFKKKTTVKEVRDALCCKEKHCLDRRGGGGDVLISVMGGISHSEAWYMAARRVWIHRINTPKTFFDVNLKLLHQG